MDARRSAFDSVVRRFFTWGGLVSLAGVLVILGGTLQLLGRADWSTRELLVGVGAVATLAAAIWDSHRETRRAGATARRDVAREQALFRDEFEQRLEVQRKLRESEALLATIIDSAPIALFATDRNGVITVCAGVGPDPLGKKPGEAAGWPASDLFADHPKVVEGIREALSGAHRQVDLRQDDQTFSLSLAPLKDASGSTAGAIVVAFDVTERRRAEEELQRTVNTLRRVDGERRALMTRVVHAQEEERRQIAADIHDDSIQSLFAVSVRLLALRSALHDPAQIAAINNLQESVHKASERLRHLLFELRPTALDEGGLPAALREYLDALKADLGIEVELTTSLEPAPASEVAVIAYRIAQEALTNVRKHARAHRVECRVSSVDAGVLTRIADDGIGFEPANSPTQPGHLGMVAMRERAEMAGGWLRTTSSPQHGCVIEYWIPNAKERAANAA